MKVLKVVIISCLILVIILALGSFIWYNSNIKAVNSENISEEDYIRVEIEDGMGTTSIAELLEENNVIKSASAMKIYVKLNSINNLKAGVYELNNSEDLATIIEHIVNGDVADDSIKVTFIEGKNMRQVAETIAENTNNSEDDVYELLEDEDYIDELIDEYWFITEDVKNEDIYYPLEGYLLPDTYVFENEDVTVEEIFSVILNYTEKFLDEYEEEINDSEFSIHEILTLASMAELEGKSTEDRAEIVGVFLNRINDGMSLGSDVTTYYAFQVDMGDRDLTATELNTENPYNTRGPNMAGKLPVGPICNPSKSAIEATLNYTETNAYYFVADKNGKVYFTTTNAEHNKMIQTLKDNDLWYTY